MLTRHLNTDNLPFCTSLTSSSNLYVSKRRLNLLFNSKGHQYSALSSDRVLDALHLPHPQASIWRLTLYNSSLFTYLRICIALDPWSFRLNSASISKIACARAILKGFTRGGHPQRPFWQQGNGTTAVATVARGLSLIALPARLPLRRFRQCIL